VLTDRDVKAALTGKDTRLLLHALVAAARAGVLLLGVAVVGILLAGQGQVKPHVHRHFPAIDLRAGQRGVVTAADGQVIPGIDGCNSVSNLEAGGVLVCVISTSAIMFPKYCRRHCLQRWLESCIYDRCSKTAPSSGG